MDICHPKVYPKTYSGWFYKAGDTKMTRALIIGYGRAGRRHGATLDKLGIKWDYYDPYVPIGAFPKEPGHIYTKVEELKGSYDFAVICTPPNLHLDQIRTCLDAGIPILCEKPLCALGQLEEAEALLTHPLAHRVMMAFNFRFHPILVAIKRQQEKWEQLGGQWACFSDQHRTDIPEWGLLLDHVSHSVDILLWLSGSDTLEIRQATHSRNESMEVWFMDGTIPQGDSHPNFNIWESVRKAEVNTKVKRGVVPKRAWVSGPFGNVEVAAQDQEQEAEIRKQMMNNMYKVFLAHLEGSGGFPICLEDGVRVQRVLEKVMEVAK